MAQDGKLRLQLVDVHGRRLQEKVDISLRNLHLSHAPFLKSVDASKIINITHLHTGTQGIYQIDIDPPSYNPVSRFVNIRTSGSTEETFPFPVDISKVVSVDFPSFSSLTRELRDLLNRSSNRFGLGADAGQLLYDAQDDIRRAGLLNIARKSQATAFPSDNRVLSLISEIVQFEGDRIKATVQRELFEETRHSVNTGLFHEAPGSQHHPPVGFSDFALAKSYKTNDRYGNLQITFFRRVDDFVVDIDIDDAGGLGHVFQVLRNHFSGKPTHPYNIREILIAHQHLDPRYNFNLR